MTHGIGTLGLAHVRHVVLVALRERGDRGREGGVAEEVVGLEGHARQPTVRARRVRRDGGPPDASRRARGQSRAMQRNPMWLVDVSIASPCRAAGR